MFRKQVNPRIAAVALILILGVVQFAYWRLLVYREPGRPPGPGGPGGGGRAEPLLLGLETVTVETFAGSDPGYEDGPPWKARFCGPNALALDAEGALLVADSRNHRIRKVDRNGRVLTLAGSGPVEGTGGRAVGPALQARFRFPSGVAVLSDRAIAIADTGNHRICLLRDGQVTELAGGAAGSVDGRGPAARFQSPAALTVGPDGALWVLEAAGPKVRRVDLQGRVTTPGQVPAVVRRGLGETRATPPVERMAGWEEEWTAPAESQFKVGLRGAAFAPAGKPVVVPDAGNSVLLVQPEKGLPVLLAGRVTGADLSHQASDGDGTRVGFSVPCAAVTAPDGTAYVAEYEGHRIRKVHLPEWLIRGEFTSPEPRGEWRQRRGN